MYFSPHLHRREGQEGEEDGESGASGDIEAFLGQRTIERGLSPTPMPITHALALPSDALLLLALSGNSGTLRIFLQGAPSAKRMEHRAITSPAALGRRTLCP